MSESRRGGRRRRGAAALLLVGACLVGCDSTPTTAATPVQQELSADSASTPPGSATASTTSLPAAKPDWMEIPAIGVRTGQIIDLGLQPDETLEVPGDAVTAGWFTGGPTPGETGPAIVAGHVDYQHVAGVFQRLKDLPSGAEVTVHRVDGTTAVFAVRSVEHYAKVEFPADEVYGDTAGPELRLITCGGAFDRSSGNYEDNIVAYAELLRSFQG